MTLDARRELFGQPSDSLAPEAVWIHREEYGDWPLIEEAIDALADFAEVDAAESERRILDAIRSGDLESRLRGGLFLVGFSVAVPPTIADRIVRRYMDVTLHRRDREETL